MGTPQPTARPRLVPKSTAAMRDSLSKTGPGGARPGGSGPDPNQVWNKNRRMYISAIGPLRLELTIGFRYSCATGTPKPLDGRRVEAAVRYPYDFSDPRRRRGI